MWVVSTNSNQCHIYHYQRNLKKLTLLKQLNHPENRMKTGDYLTSDKPGHFRTDTSGCGGAFVPHTDPKQVAIDHFAQEIARELNQGRVTNAYEGLVIITPSHMEGMISTHLNKNVKELITHTIHKDLSQLTERELLDFLHINTHYLNKS